MARRPGVRGHAGQQTAAERERARALRQIDLQLARDLLAVEKELANRVTGTE